MFSRLAVRHPIATIMAFTAAVLLGAVSYRELAIQLFPDITLPMMVIWVNKDGSSTDLLETVTKPIEGLVAQMPRVKQVNSYTRKDRARVFVEFEYGTDMRFTVIDAEERLQNWRRAQDDPRIRLGIWPFTTEDMANEYMELHFQVPERRSKLTNDLLDRVEQRLKSIQGVSDVQIRGRVFDTVRVVFDPDKLKSYGLNLGDIIGRVGQAAAEQPDLGRMDTTTGHVFVRIGDRINNVEQLEQIPVDTKGTIRLRDVSDIARGGTQDEFIFRINGFMSIGLDLSKEAGVNLIELAHTTREQIEEINKTLPTGYKLIINQDAAEIIEKTLSQMGYLALMGAVLAGLVPLFFLRSFRMAIIIFLSVPISLITTFNLMYACGLSINILTIVGLAIGVSILVDNSIVVLENGFRLAERGLPPNEAAERGGLEVGRALLASTATTLVVFVPIFFSSGPIRIIFREGGLAVAFPLIISLVVALTLVPVLTARALSLAAPGHQGPIARFLERYAWSHLRRLWPYNRGAKHRPRALAREAYRALLKRVLRNRGRTIAIIAGLCIFTYIEQGASLRHSVFDQQAREEYMNFFLQYPRGTKLTQVDAAVKVVEKRLSEHEAIERFWTWFNDDQAYFGILLKPYDKRPGRLAMQEFRSKIFDYIGPVPGGILSFQSKTEPVSDALPMTGQEGRIELRGSDLPVLMAMAERLRPALLTIPDITQVEVEESTDNPEMDVKLDRERAALFNVDSRTVARYIMSTRSSGTLSTLKLEDGENRIDVVFELGGDTRETADDIRSLPIYSSVVGAVPLSEVALFQESFTNTRFNRQNRQQSLNLTVRVRDGANVSKVIEQARDLGLSMPNPGGASILTAGRERERHERENQAAFMLNLGILLVFMVMAFIFESYWVPAVIMCSIPLISIGVTWALIITDQPMDDLVWFGILMLAGLVVNAPIVMLDLCQTFRKEHGFRRIRAIFQACDQRLRPVSMTVLTTVIGLLPLAVKRTEGGQSSGMAITIIGGLLSSTILTLLVIPCLYLASEDALRFVAPPFVWSARRAAWFFGRINAAATWMFDQFPGWLWRRRLWRVWLWPWWLLKAIWWTLRMAWRGIKGFWRGLRWTLRTTRILIVWSWRLAKRLLRHRPQGAGTAGIHDINRELPSPLSLARHLPDFSPDALPVQVQSLYVMYSQWRAKDLLRVVPSRRYAIGCRPRGGFEALHDLNFTIEPGLFGLLGPNGAGKSTLLRCLAGLIRASGGVVKLCGAPLRDHPEALTPMIGYLPQYHGQYDQMTLRQFLEYFLLLRLRGQGGRIDRRQLDRAVAAAAEEVHLTEVMDERLGAFSGGMRQRAGLARVLLGAPPILLVDEPTAGLDPLERVKVRLLLAQLAHTRTVVFSTHLVEDLELSCRSVGIVRQGRLLYTGAPGDLLGKLRGRLWEVPVEGGDGEEAQSPKWRAGIEASLFRVVRPEGLRWRCVASHRPTPDSLPAEPRLEDAFLNLLRT